MNIYKILSLFFLMINGFSFALEVILFGV